MSGWPPEPRARRWVFFRRFDIREPDGTVYLTRWRIFECPLFGVFLHRIARPDHDRALHDHPWSFASFVLRGSYREFVPSGPRDVRWFNAKRADDAHRIARIDLDSIFARPAWTLVFRGPRTRTWGFYTEAGWIPWHVYLGATEAQP